MAGNSVHVLWDWGRWRGRWARRNCRGEPPNLCETRRGGGAAKQRRMTVQGKTIAQGAAGDLLGRILVGNVNEGKCLGRALLCWRGRIRIVQGEGRSTQRGFSDCRLSAERERERVTRGMNRTVSIASCCPDPGIDAAPLPCCFLARCEGTTRNTPALDRDTSGSIWLAVWQ